MHSPSTRRLKTTQIIICVMYDDVFHPRQISHPMTWNVLVVVVVVVEATEATSSSVLVGPWDETVSWTAAAALTVGHFYLLASRAVK